MVVDSYCIPNVEDVYFVGIQKCVTYNLYMKTIQVTQGEVFQKLNSPIKQFYFNATLSASFATFCAKCTKMVSTIKCSIIYGIMSKCVFPKSNKQHTHKCHLSCI
jgi:hypothetical protein